ncbi:KAP family P-loop NTPase fold protein [Telmatobacter bradus]|uniref:KAP family P-loop NTPase fold protein n=1 Tax=Telmatobacter bradus TaxID=474953 RepID=UPI003B439652
MKNLVLGKWSSICDSAKRETFPCILSFAVGILLWAVSRLFFVDPIFHQVLLARYGSFLKIAAPSAPYAIYALTIAGAIVLMASFKIAALSWRALKSWFAGVYSGMPVVSFFAALLFCATETKALHVRAFWSAVCVLFGCFASYVLKRKALSKSKLSADPKDFSVGKEPISRKTMPSEFDEPIDAWEDDLLGRAPLIEIVSIKLLVAMKPVIALNGKLGVGKTSLLNLLRRHLKGRAIVVYFSTWLPGSEETLVKYLLSDIAAECRKQYIVPGLRHGSRRLANALAKSVPHLQGAVELIPASTQRDDIEGLKQALCRLPKRVVVLLDEIDRMQQQEIASLLKMLRGISALPNLSFVCALDIDKILETAKLQNNQDQKEYFEKFFVEIIPISEPEIDTLHELGAHAIVRSFERTDWFASKAEESDLQKKVEDLWDECIAPFCTNLRKVGLLANDVHATAALLRREANPTDLVLIQTLRRFSPAVYDLISKNSLTLSGQVTNISKYRPISDEEKRTIEKNLVGDIDKLSTEPDEKEAVAKILSELFPLYRGLDGRLNIVRNTVRDTPEKDRGVQNPAMFDAYFRYELPRDVFSVVRLERILDSLNGAQNQQQANQVLVDALDSMKPGSGKRADFLYKLSQAASSLPQSGAKMLAFSAMECADRYAYDPSFGIFGESYYAYQTVVVALLKIAESDRHQMVRECIGRTTNDAMAFALLAELTSSERLEKRGDVSLFIPVSDLYNAFILRMRTRFGEEADASDPKLLATSSRLAFNYWGLPQPSDNKISVSPEDRKLQEFFWIRHVGTSKKVLAETFDRFFLPMMRYTSDPTALVENFISIPSLRKLYEEATNEEGLTKESQGALRRLSNLLDGKYRDEVPMDEWKE